MAEAENSSTADRRLIIIVIGWLQRPHLMVRAAKSCFACRPQVPRRRLLVVSLFISGALPVVFFAASAVKRDF